MTELSTDGCGLHKVFLSALSVEAGVALRGPEQLGSQVDSVVTFLD